MTERKRLFKGTSKSKAFYNLRIYHSGASRVLAVTKLLPGHWIFVRVQATITSPDKVMLEVTKLAENGKLAQVTSTNQTGKREP